MKKQVSLALAALMAVSLTACGSSAGNPSGTNAAAAAETQTAGTGSQGGEAAAAVSSGKTDLTIINTVEPQTLVVGTESISAGLLIQCQVYDTLVMEQNGDRNTLIPGLATDWEYSEDGTTLTFTLREGVRFHDGTVMTADDVVFSLQRAAEGAYNADAAALIASIEKVDDSHVSVTTQYAYKPFLSILAMPTFGIFSKDWYEKCEAEGVNMARAENGTGAYKFVEWQSGDYLKLEAFEDYWDGAPEIKTITMKIMTDGQTAALSMQSGEADVFFGLDSADYETMKSTPHMVVWDVLSNGTHFLALNCADGRWLGENKEARKAIQYSLNREEINLGGLDGTGHVSPYPVNPGHFGYDPDWEPTPFDLDKAKELLASSGYDGSVITYKAANSSWYQNPAQVMAEEMRKAGLNVDLQIMERGAWEDEVDAGGDADIWNYMTWGIFPDADADLYGFLHTSQQGIEYANMIYAGNEACDAALDGGRYSIDDEERIAYYREVADINEEEAWYSFLMTGCNFVVTTDKIHGFAAHPACFYHVKDWNF